VRLIKASNRFGNEEKTVEELAIATAKALKRMLHDSSPSRLYAASYFQDNNDHTEDSTGKNMTQPLIMSPASLEDEEQTLLLKERQSRGILYKSSYYRYRRHLDPAQRRN
jgi:hypothetical protein